MPDRDGKWLFFSVAPGSAGLPGTGVAGEASCVPPEPEADEFASAANGANSQYYDGNGAICDGNAGAVGNAGQPSPAIAALVSWGRPWTYWCPLAQRRSHLQR